MAVAFHVERRESSLARFAACRSGRSPAGAGASGTGICTVMIVPPPSDPDTAIVPPSCRTKIATSSEPCFPGALDGCPRRYRRRSAPPGRRSVRRSARRTTFRRNGALPAGENHTGRAGRVTSFPNRTQAAAELTPSGVGPPGRGAWRGRSPRPGPEGSGSGPPGRRAWGLRSPPPSSAGARRSRARSGPRRCCRG